MLTPWKKSYDQPRQHIKKQRHYFVNKGLCSQDYGFSSGQVWMWDLNYKESSVLKNWCFWTVVLEKTLESLLNCKEIQPVHPKGDRSWVFIWRTDFESATPVLWPPEFKNWLIGKDPDARKDWRQEEKGTTEDRLSDGITDSWTWVWVDSGSWWWTGRPGVLQSIGLQRVGHDWATELNWIDHSLCCTVLWVLTNAYYLVATIVVSHRIVSMHSKSHALHTHSFLLPSSP